MHRGWPVAAVAINNLVNAAQLAVRILSLDDVDIPKKRSASRRSNSLVNKESWKDGARGLRSLRFGKRLFSGSERAEYTMSKALRCRKEKHIFHHILMMTVVHHFFWRLDVLRLFSCSKVKSKHPRQVTLAFNSVMYNHGPFSLALFMSFSNQSTHKNC